MFEIRKGAVLEVLKDQRLLHPDTRNIVRRGEVVTIHDTALAQKYIDIGLCKLVSWITGKAENKMLKVEEETKQIEPDVQEITEEPETEIITDKFTQHKITVAKKKPCKKCGKNKKKV